VAPVALTRMTENLGMGQLPEEAKEMLAPRWISPIITWLVSSESKDVTGQVFEASGRGLSVAEGWHHGPTVDAVDDPTQLGKIVPDLLSQARAPERMGA
jgi:hypothetical protein